MIATAELRRIADAKLADAIDLYRLGRYDSSIYLCGYAVELALKAEICDALSWDGYPANTKDFQGLQSFRTHHLDTLLHLSGLENRVKHDFSTDWELVTEWDPEWRYLPAGSISDEECLEMLEAVTTLLGAI